MNASRIEHDFLGERPIPADAYYGIQTLRALENFHITGIPLRAEPLFVDKVQDIVGRRHPSLSPRRLLGNAP